MYEVRNKGTLTLSRPVSIELLAIAQMMISKKVAAGQSRNELVLHEVYGMIDENVNKYVDYCAGKGITIQGRINYDGDFRGAYFLSPGQHCVCLEEDALAIKAAEDDRLIAELKSRGYTLAKDTAEPDIRKDFDFILSFVKDGSASSLLGLEQLRALWTAFCIRNDLDPDTTGYDGYFTNLFNLFFEVYSDTLDEAILRMNGNDDPEKEAKSMSAEDRESLVDFLFGELLS